MVSRLTTHDSRLSTLAEYADEAVGGLVLHGGDEVYSVAGNIVAAPWWRVL